MLNRKFADLLFSAVVLLAAPSQAQYHVYWGDMHGHTTISDGKGSLDDYFIHARDDAKLDFVVVSDHDFGNAAPWKMPQEAWTQTQDKVDQYTENGKFVAIAGYEWTSQSKYWTPEEPLFEGPVKFYNHKNVYFPERVDYLFSSKDPAYNSPNLLALAVQGVGGLIQNNHLDPAANGKDQFDYDPAYSSVIVNTEMWPDTMQYQGKEYTGNTETILREFLRNGGKTGFVGSTAVKALKREDLLSDPRYNPDAERAKNGPTLLAELREMFKSQPRAHWAALLNDSECIWGPVQSPLEVVEDPQVKANNYILDVDHPEFGKVRVAASPVQFSNEPPKIRNHAPEIGADTETVLLEAGLSWEEMGALKDGGVIS